MKTQFFLSLVAFVAMNASPASAEVIRGKITTSSQLDLDYVYETTSNSFALEADALVQPKIVTLTYTPVPQEKCDALRAFFRTEDGGLNSDTVTLYHPSSPLSLKAQITYPLKSAEYAERVQADLKNKGKDVSLPKNTTSLDRTLLQLGFRWNDRALSILGKNDLQTKMQKALQNTWNYAETDAGFVASATVQQALPSLICDLQEKNLAFTVNYEFLNSFYYSDRGNVQPNLLMNLWKQLSLKSSRIDQIAARSESMNNRDARLIAAGSLLTLEIMNSAPRSNLLQPEAFLKTFGSVFNTPTVEVSRFFNETTAEDLADRIGKRNEIKLKPAKGNVDL